MNRKYLLYISVMLIMLVGCLGTSTPILYATAAIEDKSTITQIQRPTMTNSPTLSPTLTPSQSCKNAFLYKPFHGAYHILNYFDHEYPIQERNGSIVTWWGERSTTIGYDGHPAIDWDMPEGTVLLASVGGWVRSAGDEVERECQGSPPCPAGQVPCTTIVKRIVIDTRFNRKDGAWEGFIISYYHLSKIEIQEGQIVQSGQPIGLSGQTGCAPSPHLHFQVWWSDANGKWSPVDPYGWTGSTDIPKDPWAASPDGAKSCYLWVEEP